MLRGTPSISSSSSSCLASLGSAAAAAAPEGGGARWRRPLPRMPPECLGATEVAFAGVAAAKGGGAAAGDAVKTPVPLIVVRIPVTQELLPAVTVTNGGLGMGPIPS